MRLGRIGAVLAVGLAPSLAGCTGLLLQQETGFNRTAWRNLTSSPR